MIPQDTLQIPPMPAVFLVPDGDDSITDIHDLELGGIGISDPSKGLQYQTWTLDVLGSGTGTYVSLTAPNTAATTIFSSPGITWARLTFDQNMHPFVAFIDQNGAAFFWWDPTIPGNTITRMVAGVSFPCCSMDDKRNVATLVGWNDIILAYVRSQNLYYVQQRDRYATERLLYTNLTTMTPNPTLWKVGMNYDFRLQFSIRGVLYGT